jgi:hypothetical protein
MATRVRGDERLGQDGDVGNEGLRTEKVQIENSYFTRLAQRAKTAEKLRNRLGQQAAISGTGTPASEDVATGEPEKPAGPVIYNDDGSIYKKPG